MLPRDLHARGLIGSARSIPTPMHEDLLSALREPSGLILVTGPTGQGKTTAIAGVLADPRCPPDVVFVGDIRGDVQDVFRAIELAHSRVVVAVLRSGERAGAFGRLADMGVPARDLAEVVRDVFTARLLRPATSEPVLIHERLVVTNAIRKLILAGCDQEALHQQAFADGMRSLREAGLEHVRADRLTQAAVVYATPDD